MRKRLFAVSAVLAMVAVACGKSSGTSSGGNDLLAQVMKNKVLRVSTDPAYPPQSSLNKTTGKWQGFDIDVATEIARRLGVKVQWETPSWDTITSGHWSGRWDISVGSMTVTPQRAGVLYFTPAYYYTPAGLAVYKTNTTFQKPEDLSGRKIGVCGDCTYEQYLQHSLVIPDYNIDFKISNPDIHTYDTDTTAIADLALGDGVRLDAVMSAVPTLQEAVKDGKPIRLINPPLFFEPLAVALDKSSPLSAVSLWHKISDIVDQMHADGTLSRLSMKWYHTDLTKASA